MQPSMFIRAWDRHRNLWFATPVARLNIGFNDEAKYFVICMLYFFNKNQFCEKIKEKFTHLDINITVQTFTSLFLLCTWFPVVFCNVTIDTYIFHYHSDREKFFLQRLASFSRLAHSFFSSHHATIQQIFKCKLGPLVSPMQKSSLTEKAYCSGASCIFHQVVKVSKNGNISLNKINEVLTVKGKNAICSLVKLFIYYLPQNSEKL